MIAPPGYPNTTSTPWLTSVSHRISEPVSVLGVVCGWVSSFFAASSMGKLFELGPRADAQPKGVGSLVGTGENEGANRGRKKKKPPHRQGAGAENRRRSLANRPPHPGIRDRGVRSHQRSRARDRKSVV